MQVSKNQIESARKANLADFFRSSGYKCEQHGNELHVRGFGGLYVNTSTNSWYQFSENRGEKNPVNCLTEVLGMDFTSAVSALSTEAFRKENVSVSQKTVPKKESEPFITVVGSLTTGFDVASVGFETNRKYSVAEFNTVLKKANELWINSDRYNGNAIHNDTVVLSIENLDKTACSFKFNLLTEYGSIQDIVELNPMPIFASVSRDAAIEKLNNAEIKLHEKKQGGSMEIPINEHEKKRIFAYLIKERKIDVKLIQELVNKKLLYQGSVKYEDKDGNEKFAKGNVVFLQKDKNGNTVGAEIHGTNTYKSFKAIAGAGDENLFQYPIGTPKKVYAFESAIDLLSFKMLANPEKIKDSLLVSMGGLKPNALKKFEAEGLKIYSCVDNDDRGKKFNEVNGFQSAGRKLSEEGVKDWNELLQKRVQELSKNIEASTEKFNQKVVAPTDKTEKKITHKSSPKR